MTRITRVEVIDENGRSYVNWEEDNDITLSYQDDGRTLKVFVNTMKPKTGEERALEALDKFQNDWLLGKKCPETKLEIKNLNSVESIKAEIKVLQSKLEFYEELEKTKSSVEEAYKDWMGVCILQLIQVLIIFLILGGEHFRRVIMLLMKKK